MFIRKQCTMKISVVYEQETYDGIEIAMGIGSKLSLIKTIRNVNINEKEFFF